MTLKRDIARELFRTLNAPQGLQADLTKHRRVVTSWDSRAVDHRPVALVALHGGNGCRVRGFVRSLARGPSPVRSCTDNSTVLYG